jgi:hydrogenase nickel incorporation protein HypA/HybF
MHESVLARSLLHGALECMTREGASRVVRVSAWVAETETLSREGLALHFAAVAQGTAAEGAVLELEVTHVGARCAECGVDYLPEHHLLLCPQCGCGEGQLLGETGLGVRAVEVG